MPLHIIRQDISKMKCDAIVNTTNEDMVGYSGVDLAIHERAGKGIDEECARLAPLELGFAKITGGYNLNCKYVIHTSGPIWEGGKRGEKAILKSCYLESLKLARQYNCQTVAFPLISAGVYGYPKDQVLPYAMEVISDFLSENEMTVYICVFDKSAYEISKTLSDDISSYIDDHYVEDHSDEYFYSSRWTKKSENEKMSSLKEHPSPRMAPIMASEAFPDNGSLESFLHKKGDGFADALFALIDKKGLSDVECYKKANISKQTFSKIKKPNYKPNKSTALAFAVALKLSLKETKMLLASAGLALSHNSTFDLIVEYCIINKKYDIYLINELLFDYDQELLGSNPKE